MSVSLNAVKDLIASVLNRNPNLKNSALSGVIAAQIIDFKGRIKISNCDIHFRSDRDEEMRKPGKIIHISPYGFWLDLAVSIKRFFTGVIFGHSSGNGDLRSDLMQGRRVTIFCALDGSEAEALIEIDKQPLFL